MKCVLIPPGTAYLNWYLKYRKIKRGNDLVFRDWYLTNGVEVWKRELSRGTGRGGGGGGSMADVLACCGGGGGGMADVAACCGGGGMAHGGCETGKSSINCDGVGDAGSPSLLLLMVVRLRGELRITINSSLFEGGRGLLSYCVHGNRCRWEFRCLKNINEETNFNTRN